MKRVFLTLLAVVVILGVAGAIGFAGYRYGYVRGAQARADGQVPAFRPFDGFERRAIPGRDFGFDRDVHPRFGMRGLPMMGFGFFRPLRFLGNLLILALLAWLVYWLITRSGWRLVRETPAPLPPREEPPVRADTGGTENE